MPTDQNTPFPSAPQRKRFILSGHSAALDPAICAVRDDLADVELANRVFAPHYAKALSCRVVEATLLHVKPDAAANQLGLLTVGTAVDLFDINAGWSWVRAAQGVGYVPSSSIVPA